MPSPKDYFRYAQECARSASERKYQDYREVLIEMAPVLTQLRWHESEIAEEPRKANEIVELSPPGASH